MKLSIIIPIYNVENTLRRCLDSVISQYIDDCEIILVDDGSTDNSGIIADEYACKFPFIQIYHKKNCGPSDARNYGLDRMNGDYVTFIDSDDELSPNTLEPLLNILHNHPEYDILEYSVLQNPGEHNETFLDLGNHIYPNALDWLMNNGTRHCWMWNKIFKSNLFTQLRFPHNLLRFEDIWMMNDLLALNPHIATTSQGEYKYYRNNNGLMASNSNFTYLLTNQMNIVRTHNIDIRERRWHRLNMDMYDIQLYVYLLTGNILIPSQKVVSSMKYPGIQGLIKSLALDIFGLKYSCKLFGLYNRYINKRIRYTCLDYRQTLFKEKHHKQMVAHHK